MVVNRRIQGRKKLGMACDVGFVKDPTATVSPLVATQGLKRAIMPDAMGTVEVLRCPAAAGTKLDTARG